MRTPTYMTTSIQNKIITEEILGMCIYSCNKRAKNCRDKIREYKDRYRHMPYEYTAQYRENRNYYYSMKDTFLSLVKPICIHTTTSSKSVYDGRDYVGEDKVMCFFLYYKVGTYSFHQPIEEDKMPAVLPIKDIGELTTYGTDIEKLLSVDFCKKVLALIKSGDYTYIP